MTADHLDRYRRQLSGEDQALYEAELASALSPTSPEELGLVDCEVDTGGHAAPRKAA